MEWDGWESGGREVREEWERGGREVGERESGNII